MELAGLIIAICGLILAIPSAAVSYRDWRRGSPREPFPQPAAAGPAAAQGATTTARSPAGPPPQQPQASSRSQALPGPVSARSGSVIGAPLSIARRLLAAFIDYWMVVVLAYLVSIVFAPNGFDATATEDESNLALGVSLAALVPLLLAYVWLLGRTGRSIGNLVVGARVVRVDHGGAPGFGRALGRTALALLLIYLVIPLLIAYAVASRRPDRMAVQDLATGTRPVRVLKKSEARARSGIPAPE